MPCGLNRKDLLLFKIAFQCCVSYCLYFKYKGRGATLGATPAAAGLLHFIRKFFFFSRLEDLDLLVALRAVTNLTESVRSEAAFENLWAASVNYTEKHYTVGFLSHDDLSIQPRHRKVPKRLIGTIMDSLMTTAAAGAN